MKLAIVGSGPLALFAARHFFQIGAEVVLFQKNPLGGNIRFLLSHFPEMEIEFENQKVSLKDFWQTELVPAVNFVEEHKLTKAGEVLRIHKRFLHPNEKLNNKSRLHDLFRVIYSVNPKEAILAQLAENPEMFSKLGEQVLNSLHAPVESFEDFDIVIDARGLGKEPLPMGPSNALALNEKNIQETAPLHYEKDILTKLNLENVKNLILVGNSDAAILALLKCREWLFGKPENTLTWITPTPVKTSRKNTWLNVEAEKILNFSEVHFDKAKSDFEIKMHEWRDLEDYIKVKVPKPLEPIAKINIFEGYDVTSVDRLLDRQGVFATFESPDFRECAKVVNDMRTLPADAILIAFGTDESELLSRGLQLAEPGYYQLKGDTLTEGLTGILEIEQKILSFFSRAQ